MEKIDTANELNFKVTNTNNKQTLIDENCCTLLTISLTNSGDIFTTFLGAYNEDILKLLKHTQKQYYKNLIKKLRSSETLTGKADVMEEENKQAEEVKQKQEPVKKTKATNIVDKKLEKNNKSKKGKSENEKK